MTVKLQTEQQLEFLSLKGSCTCSSESTLVEMPLCWKFTCRGSCRVKSGNFGQRGKFGHTFANCENPDETAH